MQKQFITYQDNKKRDYIDSSLKRLFNSTDDNEKISLIRTLSHFLNHEDLRDKLIDFKGREKSENVIFYYEYYLNNKEHKLRPQSYIKEKALRSKVDKELQQDISNFNLTHNVSAELTKKIMYLRANKH